MSYHSPERPPESPATQGSIIALLHLTDEKIQTRPGPGPHRSIEHMESTFDGEIVDVALYQTPIETNDTGEVARISVKPKWDCGAFATKYTVFGGNSLSIERSYPSVPPSLVDYYDDDSGTFYREQYKEAVNLHYATDGKEDRARGLHFVSEDSAQALIETLTEAAITPEYIALLEMVEKEMRQNERRKNINAKLDAIRDKGHRVADVCRTLLWMTQNRRRTM